MGGELRRIGYRSETRWWTARTNLAIDAMASAMPPTILVAYLPACPTGPSGAADSSHPVHMELFRAWWRSRAHRDLQAAFLVTTLGAVVATVTWIRLFRYPDEGLVSLLLHAPATALSLASPLVLWVGIWLWLRYGAERPSAAALHRLLVQPIARSRGLLLIATAAGTAVIALATMRIAGTERVVLRVATPVAGAWRVYPRCADSDQPEVSCPPPRDVRGGSVVLRLPRRGGTVVIESSDGAVRLAHAIPADHTIVLPEVVPAAPHVDPTRPTVVLFSTAPSEGCTPPLFLGENVVRRLRPLAADRVQLVAEPFPYDDKVMEAWAAGGVRPFLSVAGVCDAYQLRLTFRLSRTDFVIPMGDAVKAPFILPIHLDSLPPQPLALSASMDASVLLDDYPAQVGATIRLLLGVEAMADSGAAAALPWLRDPIPGGDSLRAGDEALRAALAAVAMSERRESGIVDEVVRAVGALDRTHPGSRDVVSNDEVMRHLPRLVALAYSLATAPILMAQASKPGTAPLSPLEPEGVLQLYRRSFGQSWLRLLRFEERYQYYAVDEFFRILPPEEESEVREAYMSLPQQLESLPDSAHAKMCSTIKLPDGRPWSPFLEWVETGRKVLTCKECRPPEWFLEHLERMATLCDS